MIYAKPPQLGKEALADAQPETEVFRTVSDFPSPGNGGQGPYKKKLRTSHLNKQGAFHNSMGLVITKSAYSML